MQRRLLLTVLLALVLVVPVVGAQGDDPVLQGTEDLEFVDWVTGPDSPNQTDVEYDIYGTDLGSMFAQGETLYIAFGDTFGCCPPASGGAGGGHWRNNVLAYTTDDDPSDGITFDGMITEPDGTARAVLRKGRDDVTIIPTGGIAVEDRLYLHYMAVGEWGPPGQWTLNRSGWAYSDDAGETWTQPPDAIWEGDTNFGQVALVEHEDLIYVYGIHGGRFGGVMLARVAPDAILDMAAYTYWDGSDWVPDLEDAVEIVPDPVGELSVAWNDYLDRWIMTYLDEYQAAIVIREAPDLIGPWSDSTVLVSGTEYGSLYGAYLHPWASDGEVIYFNMSQWGPYNVLLMRARLVKAE